MNVREILNELEVHYQEHGQHHHTTPGNLQIDCPFCSPDSFHYRLGISTRNGHCHCWVCGSLRLSSVLMESAGVGLSRALELIGGLERELPEKRERGKLVIPPGVGELLPAHREYLRSRRIDPDACAEQWGVRGIGIDSKLGWRLWIPIRDGGGATISWTTRSISPHGKITRYINARPDQELSSPKTCLLSSLEGTSAPFAVLVCEGPLDSIRVGPGAVATFGLGISQAQIRLIAKYPVRYICLDAEPHAQTKAREVCRLLAPFPGKTHNVLLDSGKDPGDCNEKELKQLRRLIQ